MKTGTNSSAWRQDPLMALERVDTMTNRSPSRRGRASTNLPRPWLPWILSVFVILLAAFTIAAPAWADALPVPPPGARAYSMGGAFVAVVDDPSALYWNPAALGLGHIQLHGSVVGQNLNQLSELRTLAEALENEETDTLLELANQSIEIPLHAFGAVSFGPVALGLGARGSATAHVDGTETTAEYLLVKPIQAGIGLPVVSLPPLGELRVGATATYATGTHAIWEASSYKTTETTGRGFALDLGARLALTPWLSAGAVAHDVVNTFTWEQDSLPAPEPSWQVGLQATPPIAGLTLAADLDSEQLLHVGGEWRILGLLALRGGYIHPLADEALPSDLAQVRAGIGLNFLIGRVDVGVGFAGDPLEARELALEASFGF